MLVNPSTALPLRQVLEAEAKGIVNRKAAVQLIRGVIRSGATALNWSWEEVRNKLGDFDNLLESLEEGMLDPTTRAEPSSAIIDLEEELAIEEAAGDQAAIAAPPPLPITETVLPITETVPGPAAQFTDPNLLAAAQQMAAPAPAPAPPAGGGVDSAMRKRYASLYPNDMVSELIGQGVGSLPA
jgi:hypothetical protein